MLVGNGKRGKQSTLKPWLGEDFVNLHFCRGESLQAWSCPRAAPGDGQGELLGGGCSIDWNKAKVPSVGCCLFFCWLSVPLPAGTGARHDTVGSVGRELGLLSGWHSGIFPAWWWRQAGKSQILALARAAGLACSPCAADAALSPSPGLWLPVGGVGVSLGARHLQCPCAGHGDLSTELILCWQE